MRTGQKVCCELDCCFEPPDSFLLPNLQAATLSIGVDFGVETGAQGLRVIY